MLKIELESKTRYGESVSGDVFINFSHGDKQVCILCDGMGSGSRARAQSEFAASYLAQLIKSGVSPESAAFSVSSAIAAKNRDDFFSTADILIADKNTMKARFIEAGAAPSEVADQFEQSIIFQNGNALIAEGVSLPLGVLPTAPIEVVECDITYGCKILMLSDGLLCGITTEQLCSAVKASGRKSLIERLYGTKPSRYSDDITAALIEIVKGAEL